MKKKETIEQAIVEKSILKWSNHLNGQKGNGPSDIHQEVVIPHEETNYNHFESLDNGLMMSTSEILDFSSGVDSTEYDNK